MTLTFQLPYAQKRPLICTTHGAGKAPWNVITVTKRNNPPYSCSGLNLAMKSVSSCLTCQHEAPSNEHYTAMIHNVVRAHDSSYFMLPSCKQPLCCMNSTCIAFDMKVQVFIWYMYQLDLPLSKQLLKYEINCKLS